VYDSRTGILLLGKVFKFGGTVSYVLAGVTLGVAGLIAIATGDFFPLLFVPPLVGIGIIGREIGGSIQGKNINYTRSGLYSNYRGIEFVNA